MLGRWKSANVSILGFLTVVTAWAAQLDSAVAVTRGELLLERVNALEESAVKLHKFYSNWLRESGQFESRADDTLYANLCVFRTTCRTLAIQARAEEAPKRYLRQAEDLVTRMGIFERYLEHGGMDPSVRKLMEDARQFADSFRGVYEPLVLPPASEGLRDLTALRSRPRVRPIRLFLNGYDVMDYLGGRWGAR